MSSAALAVSAPAALRPPAPAAPSAGAPPASGTPPGSSLLQTHALVVSLRTIPPSFSSTPGPPFRSFDRISFPGSVVRGGPNQTIKSGPTESNEINILRFSSVYGPRLRLYDGEATIIAQIAGWIRSGQRPSLFEDGRQMRDWVYVGDVVAAITRLLGGAEAPSVVNVCSGVGTPLAEACEAIASAYGVRCDPELVGSFRSGDMRHCLGDPGRLRALIGRDPIPFTEGSSLAFAPYSEQGSETCAEFSSLTA